MNDRFKFRIYIKSAKMLCYDVNSFYIDRLKNKITIHFDDRTKTFKFDDVVLEQCTGLKDENGKLIYEGDILNSLYRSDGCEGLYKIVWCEGRLLPEKIGNHQQKQVTVHLTDLKWCEVIGNIHENSDLIKVGGK